MPANQEHVHLAWPLWSDLRVIPTHGESCSLVRPVEIFARSCLVDLIRMTTLVRKTIRQLRLVLSTEDKEKYMEQPIPTAPVAAAPDQPIPPAALATYNEWVKNQKEIAVMMLLTMDLEIQQNLAHLEEFHTCKQEEGQSVSSYVLKMKSYIDQLERLGHPVTLNLGIHEETLPKKVDAHPLYAIRARKVQKNKNKKPTKAAKGVQGKGKGKKAYANAEASYAPKPKNPPPPKKDNPAKDAICHHCGEVGHWRRNCPIYLTELLKKKQLSQGASTSGSVGNAIPRDGVYEIEISCSNTNDSSMYAVRNKRAKLNLDSSLLWHCRLGHISKKRIEKLQLDGLLNSTDIESLGKCVSCMSGNMARKPYSHHVERAKIYMDLDVIDFCGPLELVSRQGANYSSLFTNELSRYGYVYLLTWFTLRAKTPLPKSFWDYALKSAARILNMVPTKKVDKTPYEIWHGQAPKLSYLKVWGCEALVKRDTLTKPDKLEPRSFKCIFVGYPKKTMGYSFYNPSENKLFVARNAEFFESNLIDQEASGSLKDLEIIQEEDTNPSLDTSLNHEEDDQEIDEPQK
ncbi:retrotransposon protein, putative, ty1-copia subclass [Tanacetum coccineum]